jgi:hypothetical protein
MGFVFLEAGGDKLVAQLGPQPLDPSMHVHLHGAGRAAENDRDLFVRQADDVGERDSFALAPGELAQCWGRV